FMFLFLISWVVYGIAFYIFINGIIELPLSSLFILMVIFACAYVIGFVSFFVPGGLGVREGIMSASLVTLIPSSIAIIVALLSRVWMSGAEIIMYMSLLVVKSKSNSGV
ncbi:MAG: hypothetical protein GY855_01080, partial [candidate division Zixibacteria bacterium]|nr:hypothetical protein [candidate division Zixibacteria bacterium]